MEVLVQVVSTLFLIIGITAGESIATKAFGRFKQGWIYLIEILLFVMVLVLVLNTFVFSDISFYQIIGIYFLCGFLTIIFVRAILSGAGFLAIKINETVKIEKNQLDYALGLKKALERRSFKEKEIKKIAKEVGLSEKYIEKSMEVTRK